MALYRGLTIERLMIAILFVLVFAMAVRVPTDTDTWWHLRSGEYILEQRAIPHSDPFSHTRFGEAWIDHSWGAQIILYASFELFGGGVAPGSSGNIGLALLTAGLATLGMCFVYLMCEGNAYLRAFAVVLGAAAAAVFWSPRPQMFSFLLGAAVLYVLHLYKRRGTDRLWTLPIIVVVWVNLHGGFAVAFIFLFGTIAGEILGHIFAGGDQHVMPWVRLRKLILVTIVSLLAVALNPYGFQMLGYPFRTVGIGALQDFIQEWASPDFHEPQTWPFVILLLGIMAAIGLSRMPIDWTDLALVAGSMAMALMAGRNIAVFAIVATPVLTRHLDTWLAQRGWRIHPRRTVSGRMLLLNWSLLAVVVGGAAIKVATVLDRETMRTAQQEFFPVELAAHLREMPAEGRMFNSYNWGGYLTFAAPETPVFVDGRTDLYDDEFLRQYLDISLLRDGWAEALDRLAVDFVAIEANSVLASGLRMLPARWAEQQFDDGRSALFVRITEPS